MISRAVRPAFDSGSSDRLRFQRPWGSSSSGGSNVTAASPDGASSRSTPPVHPSSTVALRRHSDFRVNTSSPILYP